MAQQSFSQYSPEVQEKARLQLERESAGKKGTILDTPEERQAFQQLAKDTRLYSRVVYDKEYADRQKDLKEKKAQREYNKMLENLPGTMSPNIVGTGNQGGVLVKDQSGNVREVPMSPQQYQMSFNPASSSYQPSAPSQVPYTSQRQEVVGTGNQGGVLVKDQSGNVREVPMSNNIYSQMTKTQQNDFKQRFSQGLINTASKIEKGLVNKEDPQYIKYLQALSGRESRDRTLSRIRTARLRGKSSVGSEVTSFTYALLNEGEDFLVGFARQGSTIPLYNNVGVLLGYNQFATKEGLSNVGKNVREKFEGFGKTIEENPSEAGGIIAANLIPFVPYGKIVSALGYPKYSIASISQTSKVSPLSESVAKIETQSQGIAVREGMLGKKNIYFDVEQQSLYRQVQENKLVGVYKSKGQAVSPSYDLVTGRYSGKPRQITSQGKDILKTGKTQVTAYDDLYSTSVQVEGFKSFSVSKADKSTFLNLYGGLKMGDDYLIAGVSKRYVQNKGKVEILESDSSIISGIARGKLKEKEDIFRPSKQDESGLLGKYDSPELKQSQEVTDFSFLKPLSEARAKRDILTGLASRESQFSNTPLKITKVSIKVSNVQQPQSIYFGKGTYEKTDEVSALSSFFKQDYQQRVVPISRSSVSTKEESQLRYFFPTQQRERVSSFNITNTRAREDTRQIPLTRVTPLQSQRTKSSLVGKPRFTFGFKAQPSIPTKDIVVPLPYKNNKEEEDLPTERGYSVQVKRKGKFIDLLSRPVSKSRALALGSAYVDTSLSRTFKITPSKQRVKKENVRADSLYKFRTFQQRRGSRQPLTNTFIERSRFSLEKGEQRLLKTSKSKRFKYF